MKRNMTCIACPLGCALTVEYSEGSDLVSVTGNRCANGEVYAREEILAPKRTVAATVSLLSGEIPRLPVRTDRALEKELIPELLRELYRIKVRAPVVPGDFVLPDFKGTGVNVIATRRCKARSTMR